MKDLSKPVYPGPSLRGRGDAIGGGGNRSQSPFRYYGPKVVKPALLKEEEFFGVKHALAVSSGTAALVVALRPWGSAPDEVIVPAVTFIACAGAVVACNAIPVFCDVDEDLNMDPAPGPLITADKGDHGGSFARRQCGYGRIMAIARRHSLR